MAGHPDHGRKLLLFYHLCVTYFFLVFLLLSILFPLPLPVISERLLFFIEAIATLTIATRGPHIRTSSAICPQETESLVVIHCHIYFYRCNFYLASNYLNIPVTYQMFKKLSKCTKICYGKTQNKHTYNIGIKCTNFRFNTDHDWLSVCCVWVASWWAHLLPPPRLSLRLPALHPPGLLQHPPPPCIRPHSSGQASCPHQQDPSLTLYSPGLRFCLAATCGVCCGDACRAACCLFGGICAPVSIHRLAYTQCGPLRSARLPRSWAGYPVSGCLIQGDCH